MNWAKKEYGKESYGRLLPISSELMKEKYRGANHTAKRAVMIQKMREKEEGEREKLRKVKEKIIPFIKDKMWDQLKGKKILRLYPKV